MLASRCMGDSVIDGQDALFRPHRVWLFAARAGLAVALATTLYFALGPPPNGPGLLPWDKAQHFLAFYVLAGLTAAAFPKGRIWIIVAALLGLGGAIEVVQGLPMVRRDADVFDWVADTVGVTFALAPLLLARWRLQSQSGRG